MSDEIPEETGAVTEATFDPEHLSSFENKNGLKIFRKYWLPDETHSSESNPRALLFIAHGVTEHCLRYSRLAKFLTGKNFLVFSHDHVGHGQSEGDRVHIDDVDDYVADVFQHTDLMKKYFPEKAMFCIGHSMGGTITIRAAMLRPDYFSGVILIGPAIIPNPRTVTPFKKCLAKMISPMCPQAALDKIDTKALCRDRNVVKEIDEDPLIYHGGLKAKWGVAMLRMFDIIEKDMERVNFPFLILHGDKDALSSIEGSRGFVNSAKNEDKTLKEYPGAYHQLHFEPDGVALDVQDEMCRWIEQRL